MNTPAPIEQNRPDESEAQRLDRIGELLEAQRGRRAFVRSNLFLGAGWIATGTLSIQFTLESVFGYEWLWPFLWLIAALIGLARYLIWRDKHRTVTLTDRSLLHVWLFAVGICCITAVYVQGELPAAGFAVIGLSIATAFTAEQFRRIDPNRSNQSGSLVILQVIAYCGAFLAAWIFRAALDGALVWQFVLTLAAIALLLFGTGAVLRHNERAGHV